MWYQIDAVDRLSDVSGDWDDVACRGAAYSICRDAVLGRPIWAFLDGNVTALHYAHIFETVRQSGRAADIRFRSDAPGRQTLMALRITLEARQSLRLRVTTLRDRAAPLGQLWNRRLPRSSDLVLACSWCKDILVGEDWLPLLEAEVVRADLTSTCPPEVVHHICPACDRAMTRERELVAS